MYTGYNPFAKYQQDIPVAQFTRYELPPATQ